MVKTKNILSYVLLAFGFVVLASLVAHTSAQSVPQGYQADQTLQPGVIVRLLPHSATTIGPQGQTSQASMLGVVVSQNDTPLSISQNTNKPQTFVATSGEYDVLVSNQNGLINPGDYIVISAIDGVGMKAGTTEQFAVGKAVQAFDGKDGVVGTTTLSGSAGKQTVELGLIQVDINIGHNPSYSNQNSNGVPHVLASAAQVLTDHPVGAVRIYASLAVLAGTLFIAGVILYAGLRSGVTAIGRNPLAKKSITKGMTTVILMAVIVFIIGIVAVYLLLKI